MQTRTNWTPGLLVCAAGVAMSSGLAAAQNALGDGRVLDANPGSGGRFNQAAPSFARELQFRNAIVTGNAPGGLSFRGDLGYRAPGEFTGQLGSDSLFAFRRDSLYSGLADMGIRGTDALQYQFSLTTGAAPPQNLMGSLTYSRDQMGGGVGGMGASQTLANDPSYVDPRGLGLYRPSMQETDLSDALTGSMRSSSAFTTTTMLSPVLLFTFEEGIERRPFGLTASTLTGVSAVPMFDPTRPPVPGQGTGISATGTGQTTGVGQARDPRQPMARTAYEEVVDRLRQRAEAQAARSSTLVDLEMKAITDRLEALRSGLMGQDMNQAPAGQNTAGQTTPGQTTPGQTGAGQPGAGQPVPGQVGTGQSQDAQPGRPRLPDQPTVQPSVPGEAPAPGATGAPFGGPAGAQMAAERDPDRFQIDPKTLELMRALEAPLPSFIDPNADTRDLYNEHMRAGERLILAERYFDAEERFARALSVRGGDPTAQVGRAHAQLGAGLLISASLNLRTLFILHPEMIGARYVGRLLPSPDRIDILIENLRERSGVKPVPGRAEEEGGTRVAAGFLLSYLGFQVGREDVIREGLEVLRTTGSPEDVRLGAVLRQIWLDTPAGDGENDG